MQIVKPSAKLVACTPDALRVIEAAGRTCYKSASTGSEEDAQRFVRKIIERGHESVLEHASFTFRLICDRGVTHELVRHRLASYSQESTRYCRYDVTGIAVIEPPGLERCSTAEEACIEYVRCADEAEDELPCAWHTWYCAMHAAETAYMDMCTRGVTPQIARSVLPTCLKTEIVVTANAREWRHILRLRTAEAAHPQIRELMFQVAVQLPQCLTADIILLDERE